MLAPYLGERGASGGRFLQTDPIGYGDGPNVYGYVHGDPVNGVDPSGMDVEPLIVHPPETYLGEANYAHTGAPSFQPQSEESFRCSLEPETCPVDYASISEMQFNLFCSVSPSSCDNVRENLKVVFGIKFNSKQQNELQKAFFGQSTTASLLKINEGTKVISYYHMDKRGNKITDREVMYMTKEAYAIVDNITSRASNTSNNPLISSGRSGFLSGVSQGRIVIVEELPGQG